MNSTYGRVMVELQEYNNLKIVDRGDVGASHGLSTVYEGDYTMPDHTTRQSSVKLCECGCGQVAPIAKRNDPRRGHVKGQALNYIHGHNASKQAPAPTGFKVCTRCGETKPLSEYQQRKSGSREGYRFACCKDCSGATGKSWRLANHDYVIQRLREYRVATREQRSQVYYTRKQTDPNFPQKKREEKRRSYAKNRERVQARERERTLAFPEKKRESDRKTRQRYPERHSAREAVRRAILNGELPRADSLTCSHCQEALASHYHHHKGYASEFKLDVIALCTTCHGREHRVD